MSVEEASWTGNGLTDLELEALELTGRLANLCGRIIGDGPQRDNDWGEMAMRINAVQHMIMSQAAARAHPDQFRLLGQRRTNHAMLTGLATNVNGDAP